ncbi:hypothetical protein HPP92_028157 [Vanilla planifolia]|uniref:Uncharacterized protein n=1 Tax=Vanilla planifolia TaxID=51239 RepID=A0A835U344_VANPL|nr:hypothetical protein HPP92_028157 [Vanilla planifolia]
MTVASGRRLCNTLDNNGYHWKQQMYWENLVFLSSKHHIGVNPPSKERSSEGSRITKRTTRGYVVGLVKAPGYKKNLERKHQPSGTFNQQLHKNM